MVSNQELIVLDVHCDGSHIKVLGQIKPKETTEMVKSMVQKFFTRGPKNRVLLSELKIGLTAMAVINSNDFSAVRVQILSLMNPQNGRVSVLLIDNCEWFSVSFTQLYHSTPEIAIIPLCSEVFVLADIMPLTREWSQYTVDVIKQSLMGKLVCGTVFRQAFKLPLFRPFDPSNQSQLFAKTLFESRLVSVLPSFPGISHFAFPLKQQSPPKAHKSVRHVKSSPTKSEPEEVPRFCSSVESGYQDECEVIHIEKGPLKFSIKMHSQRDLWVKLDHALSTIINIKEIRSSNVKHGYPVLCSKSSRYKLYRGIIIGEKSEGKIPVFQIDAGNIENIPLDRLWRVPDQLLQIPMLLTRCLLLGYSSARYKQEGDNFTKLVVGKKLRVTLGKRNTDLLYEAYFEIKSFSIEKILSRQVYDTISLVSGVQVVPIHAENEGNVVYLQLVNYELLIEKLQIHIAQMCQKLRPIDELFDGLPCIALYSEDQNWYRAMVRCHGNQLNVHYVDFGNHETKEDEALNLEIKEISTSILTSLPAQAVPCVVQSFEGRDFEHDDVYDISEGLCWTVTVTGATEIELDGRLVSLPTVTVVRCRQDENLTFNVKAENVSPVSVSPVLQEEESVVSIVQNTLHLCSLQHFHSMQHFYVNLEQNKNERMAMNEVMRHSFPENPIAQVSAGEAVMVRGSSSDVYYRAEVKSRVQDVVDLFLVDVGKEQVTSKSQVKALPSEISLSRRPPEAILCSLDRESSSPMKSTDFATQLSRNSFFVHFLEKEEGKWKVSLVNVSDKFDDFYSSKHESSRPESQNRKRLSGSEDNENWRTRPYTNGCHSEPSQFNGRTHSSNHSAKSPTEHSYGRSFNGNSNESHLSSPNPSPGHSRPMTVDHKRVKDTDPPRLMDIDSSRSMNIVPTRLLDIDPPRPMVIDPPSSLTDGPVFVSFADDKSEVVWVQRSGDSDALEGLGADLAALVAGGLPGLSNMAEYCVAQSCQDDVWYRAKVVQRSGRDVNVHFIDYGNDEQLPVDRVRELPSTFFGTRSLCTPCVFECPGLAKLLSESDVLEEEMYLKVIGQEKNACVIQLYHNKVSLESILLETDGDMPQQVPLNQLETVINVPQRSNCDNMPKVPSLSLNTGVSLELTVSHIEEDSLYVQLCSNFEIIDNLMDLIAELAPESPGILVPRVGMYCLAKYSADDQWYRARVESVDDKTFLNLVQFVDYGNSESLYSDVLKTLPKQCMDTPMQAVQCSVYDERLGQMFTEIDVDHGHDVLTDETIVGSLETVDGVFVLRYGTIKDRDLLSVLSTSEQSDITPDDTVGKVTLDNTTVDNVQQSFQHNVEDTLESDIRLDDVDMIDTVNDTDTTTQTSVDFGHTACRVLDGHLEYDTSLLLYITHCEKNKVWVQESLNTNLDDLMAEICTYAHDQNPSKFTVKPEQGTFCLSLFEDGEWYRGKVTQINDSDSVTVYYIDYGNSHDVSVKDLLVLPLAFCKLPCQTVECAIEGLSETDLVNTAVSTLMNNNFEGILTQKDGQVVLKNILMGGLPFDFEINHPIQDSKETFDKNAVPTESPEVGINEPLTSNEVEPVQEHGPNAKYEVKEEEFVDVHQSTDQLHTETTSPDEFQGTDVRYNLTDTSVDINEQVDNAEPVTKLINVNDDSNNLDNSFEDTSTKTLELKQVLPCEVDEKQPCEYDHTLNCENVKSLQNLSHVDENTSGPDGSVCEESQDDQTSAVVDEPTLINRLTSNKVDTEVLEIQTVQIEDLKASSDIRRDILQSPVLGSEVRQEPVILSPSSGSDASEISGETVYYSDVQEPEFEDVPVENSVNMESFYDCKEISSEDSCFTIPFAGDHQEYGLSTTDLQETETESCLESPEKDKNTVEINVLDESSVTITAVENMDCDMIERHMDDESHTEGLLEECTPYHLDNFSLERNDGEFILDDTLRNEGPDNESESNHKNSGYEMLFESNCETTEQECIGDNEIYKTEHMIKNYLVHSSEQIEMESDLWGTICTQGKLEVPQITVIKCDSKEEVSNFENNEERKNKAFEECNAENETYNTEQIVDNKLLDSPKQVEIENNIAGPVLIEELEEVPRNEGFQSISKHKMPADEEYDQRSSETFQEPNTETFEEKMTNETFEEHHPETFQESHTETYKDQNTETIEENTEAFREQNTETFDEQGNETVDEQNAETFKEYPTETFEERHPETCKGPNTETIEEQNTEAFKEQNTETFEERKNETFEEQNDETFKEYPTETFDKQNTETFEEQNTETFEEQDTESERNQEEKIKLDYKSEKAPSIQIEDNITVFNVLNQNVTNINKDEICTDVLNTEIISEESLLKDEICLDSKQGETNETRGYLSNVTEMETSGQDTLMKYENDFILKKRADFKPTYSFENNDNIETPEIKSEESFFKNETSINSKQAQANETHGHFGESMSETATSAQDTLMKDENNFIQKKKSDDLIKEKEGYVCEDMDNAESHVNYQYVQNDILEAETKIGDTLIKDYATDINLKNNKDILQESSGECIPVSEILDVCEEDNLQENGHIQCEDQNLHEDRHIQCEDESLQEDGHIQCEDENQGDDHIQCEDNGGTEGLKILIQKEPNDDISEAHPIEDLVIHEELQVDLQEHSEHNLETSEPLNKESKDIIQESVTNNENIPQNKVSNDIPTIEGIEQNKLEVLNVCGTENQHDDVHNTDKSDEFLALKDDLGELPGKLTQSEVHGAIEVVTGSSKLEHQADLQDQDSVIEMKGEEYVFKDKIELINEESRGLFNQNMAKHFDTEDIKLDNGNVNSLNYDSLLKLHTEDNTEMVCSTPDKNINKDYHKMMTCVDIKNIDSSKVNRELGIHDIQDTDVIDSNINCTEISWLICRTNVPASLSSDNALKEYESKLSNVKELCSRSDISFENLEKQLQEIEDKTDDKIGQHCNEDQVVSDNSCQSKSSENQAEAIGKIYHHSTPSEEKSKAKKSNPYLVSYEKQSGTKEVCDSMSVDEQTDAEKRYFTSEDLSNYQMEVMSSTVLSTISEEEFMKEQSESFNMDKSITDDEEKSAQIPTKTQNIEVKMDDLNENKDGISENSDNLGLLKEGVELRNNVVTESYDSINFKNSSQNNQISVQAQDVQIKIEDFIKNKDGISESSDDVGLVKEGDDSRSIEPKSNDVTESYEATDFKNLTQNDQNIDFESKNQSQNVDPTLYESKSQYQEYQILDSNNQIQQSELILDSQVQSQESEVILVSNNQNQDSQLILDSEIKTQSELILDSQCREKEPILDSQNQDSEQIVDSSRAIVDSQNVNQESQQILDSPKKQSEQIQDSEQNHDFPKTNVDSQNIIQESQILNSQNQNQDSEPTLDSQNEGSEHADSQIGIQESLPILNSQNLDSDVIIDSQCETQGRKHNVDFQNRESQQIIDSQSPNFVLITDSQIRSQDSERIFDSQCQDSVPILDSQKETSKLILDSLSQNQESQPVLESQSQIEESQQIFNSQRQESQEILDSRTHTQEPQPILDYKNQESQQIVSQSRDSLLILDSQNKKLDSSLNENVQPQNQDVQAVHMDSMSLRRRSHSEESLSLKLPLVQSNSYPYSYDSSRLVKDTSEWPSQADIVELAEVLAVDDEVRIWVRLKKEDWKTDVLKVALDNEIKEGLNVPSEIFIGKIYVAYFFGELVRVKVFAIKDEMARVHLIDVGYESCFSLQNIFVCPTPALFVVPLAQSHTLPLKVNKDNRTTVVSLLKERCLNTRVALVNLNPFLRNAKQNVRFGFLVNLELGSFSKFLADRGLATMFDRKDIVHQEMVSEFEDACLSTLRKEV